MVVESKHTFLAYGAMVGSFGPIAATFLALFVSWDTNIDNVIGASRRLRDGH